MSAASILSPADCWPIDTVYFIPKNMVDFWLYLTLQSVKFQNTDASVPRSESQICLQSAKVMRPSDRLRRLFNEHVAPIFSQRTTLENYNQQLAQTRAMLLPRLMGGEISV